MFLCSVSAVLFGSGEIVMEDRTDFREPFESTRATTVSMEEVSVDIDCLLCSTNTQRHILSIPQILPCEGRWEQESAIAESMTAIHRSNLSHFLLRQFEIEHIAILHDSIRRRGLRNAHRASLNGPTNHHLRG